MLSEKTLVQNRYLVKNLIGRGGMGAVYLAEDTRFNNRIIALKEMLFTNNAKLESAFGREANLLAHLHHPRLPKVSDFFNEDGHQYLVMEYVAGDDLGTLLKKNGRAFPVNRVLNWADSLLEILEFLHSQNPPIIHRDIKPQNLKLNSGDKIILLDFGLAKDTLTHLSRLAVSNSLVGFTPHYAPVEQINGDRSTTQTDLYAVSATIYHLLTNSAPASSLTRIQAKIEDRADPLLPAHQLNPEIPLRLSDILAHGLTLKRENRLSSATEMRNKLKGNADEPRKLFEVPPEKTNFNNTQQSNFNQSQSVKTMEFSPPQASTFAATHQINPENSNPVFAQPEKSGKRNSVILFGAIICLLGFGIVATYFIGQWISGKMTPQADLQKTEESNKTEILEGAASQVNTNVSNTPQIKVGKPETKPVAVVKPTPVQTQVKKPAVTKTTPIKPPPSGTKPPPPPPDSGILQ